MNSDVGAKRVVGQTGGRAGGPRSLARVNDGIIIGGTEVEDGHPSLARARSGIITIGVGSMTTMMIGMATNGVEGGAMASGGTRTCLIRLFMWIVAVLD